MALALRRVLVRVDAAFPGLLRLTVPSWHPHVLVYVARQSLPSDVDRNVPGRGYLFVEADLEAHTAAEFVESCQGWEWSVGADTEGEPPGTG